MPSQSFLDSIQLSPLPPFAEPPKLAIDLNHPKLKALLAAIFTYSPFLSRLIQQDPQWFAQCCEQGPDASFRGILNEFAQTTFTQTSELMKTMRLLKRKASLCVALADLTQLWNLEQVTAAVSELADVSVRRTVDWLLQQAKAKQEIRFSESQGGLFVLAMGKLGAHELNYSSDIDLIVFYDRDRVEYTGAQNLQQCFSKLTQEMVRILQERTADGYVFRVDLRLRPDPSSTPAAMSTNGAMTYYETVGQNWERAAFIKARAVAGDIDAANTFLKQLSPFLWRKHLDFAAIADIQSIKRQMDANHKHISLPGHNIKTGIGGIREIEFFAQIHQLIWGGRTKDLRISQTCQVLDQLVQNGLIISYVAGHLKESYRLLRTVEHRLQMIDDQQTHSIPTNQEAIEQLAKFCGFESRDAFERELLQHLNYVHELFANSFQGQGSLGDEGGKLSFTGVENDAATLDTIRKMGFANPASVSEIIQGWHRGSRRATRTKRARELITELTPQLLKALGATQQPDQAFMHFDEFLSGLPSGVQIFSLFHVNPHLLDFIALLMGSAPALAASLSKNPNLLDTVLTADFYSKPPDKDALRDELTNQLSQAKDFEEAMIAFRRFKNERYFQAGIQLIRQQITPRHASEYLSDIGEVCLELLLPVVEEEFQKKFPEYIRGALALIVMGRLGAREITFGSDIDLVFIYSDMAGEKLGAALLNKLSQRVIGALTALTPEGRLYEVDTRLRPSGKDGPLAVSVSAFEKYFKTSAWTFEFMALTRARVIASDEKLTAKLRTTIIQQLTHVRTYDTLAEDVLQIRAKIAQEFGDANPWNIKYAKGGLMELDFLVQYLALKQGKNEPKLFSNSVMHLLHNMQVQGKIDSALAESLQQAHEFLNALFMLLRLCGSPEMEEAQTPVGLKTLIARIAGQESFEAARARLLATLEEVHRHFTTTLTSQ